MLNNVGLCRYVKLSPTFIGTYVCKNDFFNERSAFALNLAP